MIRLGRIFTVRVNRVVLVKEDSEGLVDLTSIVRDLISMALDLKMFFLIYSVVAWMGEVDALEQVPISRWMWKLPLRKWYVAPSVR